MEEISKRPLTNIVNEITKKEICLKDGVLCYLNNKEPVEEAIITEATTKQDEYYDNDIRMENKRKVKEELDKLTVTLTSGKVFYSDTVSRIDIQSAIQGLLDNNLTETLWKLAEPFNDERIVNVTVEEFKEASALALTTKGNLIGVIDT